MFDDLGRFVRRNIYVFAAAAFFAALAVSFFTRKYSEWENVYLSAAMRLRAGQDLYDPAQGYLYPPFMALMAVPFTYLPAWLDRAAFFAINVAAFLFMVVSAWRIAGGKISQAAMARTEHLSFAIGLGAALPYCVGTLNHQQTDLLIGAMVLAGCLAVTSGGFIAAATYFGVAAAMKGTALLWVVFFLVHGLPLAAIWLIAVAVGLNVVPDLFSSIRVFSLGKWWRFVSGVVAGSAQPVGMWGSAIYYNQSIPGTAGRLLMARLASADGGLDPLAAHHAAIFPTKIAVYGMCAVLAAASVAVQPRQAADKNGQTVSSAALACGAMVTLMVLLSPMSSPPHFSVLMLPAFCAARLGLVAGKRVLVVLALAAVIAATLSVRTVVGHSIEEFAMGAGTVTIGALALLAACDFELVLRRTGNRAA